MTNLQIERKENFQNKVLYPELSYLLTGFLFTVHNELGRFCNEKQYGDALEKCLKERNVMYEREKILPTSFEGEVMGRNKVDFLVEEKIILELKASRMLTKEDYYQTKRYLVALNKELGILVNFRQRFLTPKRILNVI